MDNSQQQQDPTCPTSMSSSIGSDINLPLHVELHGGSIDLIGMDDDSMSCFSAETPEEKRNEDCILQSRLNESVKSKNEDSTKVRGESEQRQPHPPSTPPLPDQPNIHQHIEQVSIECDLTGGMVGEEKFDDNSHENTDIRSETSTIQEYKLNTDVSTKGNNTQNIEKNIEICTASDFKANALIEQIIYGKSYNIDHKSESPEEKNSLKKSLSTISIDTETTVTESIQEVDEKSTNGNSNESNTQSTDRTNDFLETTDNSIIVAVTKANDEPKLPALEPAALEPAKGILKKLGEEDVTIVNDIHDLQAKALQKANDLTRSSETEKENTEQSNSGSSYELKHRLDLNKGGIVDSIIDSIVSNDQVKASIISSLMESITSNSQDKLSSIDDVEDIDIRESLQSVLKSRLSVEIHQDDMKSSQRGAPSILRSDSKKKRNTPMAKQLKSRSRSERRLNDDRRRPRSRSRSKRSSSRTVRQEKDLDVKPRKNLRDDLARSESSRRRSKRNDSRNISNKHNKSENIRRKPSDKIESKSRKKPGLDVSRQRSRRQISQRQLHSEVKSPNLRNSINTGESNSTTFSDAFSSNSEQDKIDSRNRKTSLSYNDSSDRQRERSRTRSKRSCSKIRRNEPLVGNGVPPEKIMSTRHKAVGAYDLNSQDRRKATTAKQGILKEGITSSRQTEMSPIVSLDYKLLYESEKLQDEVRAWKKATRDHHKKSDATFPPNTPIASRRDLIAKSSSCRDLGSKYSSTFTTTKMKDSYGRFSESFKEINLLHPDNLLSPPHIESKERSGVERNQKSRSSDKHKLTRSKDIENAEAWANFDPFENIGGLNMRSSRSRKQTLDLVRKKSVKFASIDETPRSGRKASLIRKRASTKSMLLRRQLSTPNIGANASKPNLE